MKTVSTTLDVSPTVTSMVQRGPASRQASSPSATASAVTRYWKLAAPKESK